ncbi:MAG: sigma-70 family RNA polymerase sigma factor [Chloroflexi bacterium]|nr:sigma-70 family RNA polymerase sigma factor [Chloroflexota bacterium]
MAVTTAQMTHTDEQRLVGLSRGGDQSAFAAIVETHQAAVFGTVLRLVRDRVVAAEVSNRAFYRAYAHLADFDESRPLRPWLVRIAANEALNELRTRRRDADHTFGGEAAAIELEQLTGGPDPAELIPRRERSAAIRAAVDRLPEAQRMVVVLRYFADLSYADIADATQQTVSNVGVVLLRARERLRRELEIEGVTHDAQS